MQTDGRRLAFLGVAAGLSLAGIIAVFLAARESELGEIHARLAATIGAALLCGGVALAGVRLIERAQLLVYALANLALAALGFALFAVAIWNDDIVGERYGKALLTALLLLVSALVVSTLRLLVDRSVRPAWLAFLAVAAFVVAADLIALVGIWRTGSNEVGESDLVDDGTRALIAFFALAVVGYLVAPLVQRAFRGSRDAGDEHSAMPER